MKPIGQMTVDELKVLAYDQLKIFEQTRNNLQILETEINKRKESTNGTTPATDNG